MRDKLLMILFLLPLPMSLFAQVKGRLVSITDEAPLPFATISGFDKTGKFLCGTRSGEDGSFILETNEDLVRISFQMIGYERKDTVTSGHFQGNVGTVLLQPKVEMLDDVVAVADMVSRDASKETVYITDSLRKGTMNALQLLGKIPGITIDSSTDEVRIGKDRDVLIIVNGKEASKDYAVSLNPQRIKKIEVMRYPAGKYSDYPVILNIELASDYTGWDVSAYTRNLYSFRNKNTNREAFGTNFTYTFTKLSVYGDLSFTHRMFYDTYSYEYGNGADMLIKTEPMDHKHPNENVMTNIGSLSLGVDYKMGDGQTLSLQTWIAQKGTKENDMFNVWKGQELSRQQTKDDFKTGDYTFGLFYEGKFFDKLSVGSEVVYNRYHIREDKFFVDKDVLTLSPYKGDKDYWRCYLSVSYTLGDKLSVLADYTQTWKDYTNYSRDEGTLLYDNREIRSKVMGVLSYQPSKTLSAMLGTHVLMIRNRDGLADETEAHTSWMPLFHGYWKPARWMYFSVNYFCDVEYPNLDQLSTVQWQLNDVLWHRGNANLRPRIMHYAEFVVNFVDILKLSYMHKRSKDEIVDYYIQDEEKIYQTLDNCNYGHNYLGVEGEYKVAKCISLSLVANYQWYRRYMKDDDKHFGRTWYFDSQLLWEIPGKKLSLMVSYFLRHDKFPLLQGKQYDEEESLQLGASCSLAKGKMSVSLAFDIPTALISKQTYTKIELPNFRYQMCGDDRVNAFMANLNIKYALGRGKASRKYNERKNDKEK